MFGFGRKKKAEKDDSLERKLLVPQILTLPKVDDNFKYSTCLEAIYQLFDRFDPETTLRGELELELSLLAMAQQHRWEDFKDAIYDGLDFPDEVRKSIVRTKDCDAWSYAVVEAYLDQVGYFDGERPSNPHLRGHSMLKKAVFGVAAALTGATIALGVLVYQRPELAEQASTYIPDNITLPEFDIPELSELLPSTEPAPEPVPAPAPEPAHTKSYTPMGRVIRNIERPEGEEGCLVMVRRPDGTYTEGEFSSTEFCGTIEQGMLAYRHDPDDGNVGFCRSSQTGRCD